MADPGFLPRVHWERQILIDAEITTKKAAYTEIICKMECCHMTSAEDFQHVLMYVCFQLILKGVTWICFLFLKMSPWVKKGMKTFKQFN